MMWRYLTLLHRGHALTDDEATLSTLGFVGNVDLKVVFATRTVTEVVLVTPSMVAKHGVVGLGTPPSSSSLSSSVDNPFRSSTRLPVTRTRKG